MAVNEPKSYGPLTGLRILEIGHFIAAPFCTRVLGDMGAEIIKIEPPTGDPIRTWGQQRDGHSPWWSQHGRNKRCITLNLKHEQAREIVIRLAGQSDAVVENFRPGQLERLGLGAEMLRRDRPDLVIAHISGYGQDGPYRDRASFGVIGEAIGGIRHLTDHPPGVSDLPPVRVGVSIGDSIAGLYGAFGVMSALWQRDRAGGDQRPRSLDVALTDSVFSMTEGMLPEYSVFGTIKQPAGSSIETASPTNAYPTSDGKWILVAANSDPLFARLSKTMNRPDLIDDPKYTGNQARVRNKPELDAIIGAWTATMTADEADQVLTEADVPSCLVYTVADCAEDPQYRHRGMVQEVADPFFGKMLQTGVIPGIPEDPGGIRWTGPGIGAHTDEVLTSLLGLSEADIAALRADGAV